MRTKQVLIKAAIVLVAFLVIGLTTLYIAYSRNLYVGTSKPQEEFFIHGGILFDAVDNQPTDNPGILLKEGRIACIGITCEPSSRAIQIDATNYSILPGLIELHGHFFARTKDNAELSIPAFIWNTARAKPDVRQKLLEAGITSFRSLGDPKEAILSIKEQIDKGELAGPRLFVAGPIFTAPGGHSTYGGQDPNIGGVGGPMTFQSNDPMEVASEVAILSSQGIDGVKAVLHGTLSAEGEVILPTLSLPTLNAISKAASANDHWIAVHVGPTSTHVIEAINAGATTIEHGVRAGNLVNEEALEHLVRREIVYVPTLGREPLGHLNIPALYEAGVSIGVGTDTNNPEMAFGDSYHEELSLLVDAGLPAPDALLAATRNGAKGLRKSGDIGTIEVGKFADMILIDGKPWDDITELSSVAVVFQAGRVVVDLR